MTNTNKIDVTKIFLFAVIIGMLIYFNECKEDNRLTREEGDELAEKSDSAIQLMWNMFDKLSELDSSRTINEYYTTIYERAKNEKDSIIKSDPRLADSLLLFWNEKLRTDTINNAFNRNTW